VEEEKARDRSNNEVEKVEKGTSQIKRGMGEVQREEMEKFFPVQVRELSGD